MSQTIKGAKMVKEKYKMDSRNSRRSRGKFSFFKDLGKSKQNEKKMGRRFKFLKTEDEKPGFEVSENSDILTSTFDNDENGMIKKEKQLIKDKSKKFSLRKKTITRENLKRRGTFKSIFQTVKSLKKQREKTPTNHLVNLFDGSCTRFSDETNTEVSCEEPIRTLTVQNPTLGLYNREGNSSGDVSSFLSGSEGFDNLESDKSTSNKGCNMKDIQHEEDMESPYTYVFDTPNINSMDDSNNIEDTTVLNFKKMWSLLIKESKKEGFTTTLNNGFLLSDLSRNLLVLVEKLVEEKNNVQLKKENVQHELTEAIKRNNQLMVNMRFLNLELTQLKKAKQDTLQIYDKEASIKEQSDRIVSLESENKTFKNKLENKQYLYRKLLDIFKENSQRLKNFESQNEILKYYHVKSNNFMFSIIAEFNDIVPDEVMKTYNDSFKQLSYKFSLVNMYSASKTQINAINSQIKQFYENIALKMLIYNVVKMYAIKSRSIEFFQSKLIKLKDELNQQQLELKKVDEANRGNKMEENLNAPTVTLPLHENVKSCIHNTVWGKSPEPHCIDY